MIHTFDNQQSNIVSTSYPTGIPTERVATFYGRRLSPAEIDRVITITQVVFASTKQSYNTYADGHAENELFILSLICSMNPQVIPEYERCQSVFKRFGEMRAANFQKMLRKLESMAPK